MRQTNRSTSINAWCTKRIKAVKSNRGAAGVDKQTIEQFEADLSGNLYKIWNRMSSGTYFPPPVGRRHSQKEWRRKDFGCGQGRVDRARGVVVGA
jgi:retron-type reverse transcriptase